MLDVHILNYDPNPEFWKQCIDSVNVAVNNANYPIAIHITNGDINFGKARHEAYRLGIYPYVTFVDNDDYLLPQAFSILEPVLYQNPDAIFTRELQLGIDGKIRSVISGRHHLQIYKRSMLIDHESQGDFCDLRQLKSIKGKNCIDLLDQVYVWRIKEKRREFWNSRL